MKKALAALVLVGLLGLVVFAGPYIEVGSVGETLATQTPSFSLLVGVDVPLAQPYARIDLALYATFTLIGENRCDTWGTRVSFTYGNTFNYIKGGFNWENDGSYLPFFAFRYSFDFPFGGE